jgi:AraC-like DNA-binding protein
VLAWSPILVQKTEIHALGFVLRKLQLNRHGMTEVAPHAHRFAQLILYLSGEGLQTVDGRTHPAHAGDLFVIPAEVAHGFSLLGKSRPLCLVLDFESEKQRIRAGHRLLPQQTLNALHALLARVPTKGKLRLDHYATVIAVVAMLLDPPKRNAAEPVVASAPERIDALFRADAGIAQTARDIGYHRDHLTRKLKRETGLGLRGHRDRLRLERAEQALTRARSVSEAATIAGFDDANYFARWFKARTGRTPGSWRASSR